MAADGSIIIDTHLDTSGISSSINEIQAAFKDLAESVKGISQKIDSVLNEGVFGIPTGDGAGAGAFPGAKPYSFRAVLSGSGGGSAGTERRADHRYDGLRAGPGCICGPRSHRRTYQRGLQPPDPGRRGPCDRRVRHFAGIRGPLCLRSKRGPGGTGDSGLSGPDGAGAEACGPCPQPVPRRCGADG